MRNRNLWIFNSGFSFDGNPKYLFLYIQNHHKEIKCVWLCYNKELVRYMRHLGYRAYLYSSETARKIQKKAGVYVVNQRKEIFEPELEDITILNLWHGVGCKTVELGVDGGVLFERIIKKNIRNCSMYQQNQLFLVTSQMMENHFKKSMNLNPDNIIRGGYPCVLFDEKVETYNHDILKAKRLPQNTKIAVYAPTYRDYNRDHFFSKAIPDMKKLAQVAKENDILLILKMHPQMENDFEFSQAKKEFSKNRNILFWDNKNDFYEIMSRVDIAIVDYSSIFYDLLAKGVKNFIRYTFDQQQQQQTRSFAFDFMNYTCGTVCESFESLLKALSSPFPDDSAEIKSIYNTFWEYSSRDTFENCIESARKYEMPKEGLKNLYSFDIFDTLISRSVLQPRGVFYYVREKMMQGEESFPFHFTQNYVRLRMQAESNCREFFNKTLEHRTFTEISFDMIFERLKVLYNLTEKQTALLKEWELEAEFKTSIPIKENIDQVLELVDKGEKVILISDMYLPEEFIRKLLAKSEPRLALLPLYLSSTFGGQKTKKTLYFQAFQNQDYRYAAWIHTGDNNFADIKQASSLAIVTQKINSPVFYGYENKLAQLCPSYDAFQVAGLSARFKKNHSGEKAAIYAYCYASLYFVPYIDFCVHDALKKGIDTLYFISRDGHHLKRIADVIIQKENLPLKARYIYGSRKAWRIPSQIESIDEEFFSYFGNFTGADTVDKILKAADLTEEEFKDIFPQLRHFLNQKKLSKTERDGIIISFKNSQKYAELLLEKAKDLRESVQGYLKQEIDFSEKFAFVEYWGRGYTQTCLSRILNDICARKIDAPFYYFRTIYPSQVTDSEGNLERRNFTCANYSLLFVESVFANVPYSTTMGYNFEDGKWNPVFHNNKYKKELFEALEKYLPEFTEDWCNLDFLSREQAQKILGDFGVRYFNENITDRIFIEQVADLLYADGLNDIEQEFAPRITVLKVLKHIFGKRFCTKSFKMSLNRSSSFIKNGYNFVRKHKNLLSQYTKVKNLISKLEKKVNG